MKQTTLQFPIRKKAGRPSKKKFEVIDVVTKSPSTVVRDEISVDENVESGPAAFPTKGSNTPVKTPKRKLFGGMHIPNIK